MNSACMTSASANTSLNADANTNNRTRRRQPRQMTAGAFAMTCVFMVVTLTVLVLGVQHAKFNGDDIVGDLVGDLVGWRRNAASKITATVQHRPPSLLTQRHLPHNSHQQKQQKQQEQRQIPLTPDLTPSHRSSRRLRQHSHATPSSSTSSSSSSSLQILFMMDEASFGRQSTRRIYSLVESLSQSANDRETLLGTDVDASMQIRVDTAINADDVNAKCTQTILGDQADYDVIVHSTAHVDAVVDPTINLLLQRLQRRYPRALFVNVQRYDLDEVQAALGQVIVGRTNDDSGHHNSNDSSHDSSIESASQHQQSGSWFAGDSCWRQQVQIESSSSILFHNPFPTDRMVHLSYESSAPSYRKVYPRIQVQLLGQTVLINPTDDAQRVQTAAIGILPADTTATIQLRTIEQETLQPFRIHAVSIY